jgi:UDP-N-acetylmuramoylalanine--D-glutamate ligase
MRFSDLAHKRVGVWGAGREAASLAAHVARLPAELAVVATDAPADASALAPFGAAAAVSGDDILPALRACDVVVRSPGVSIYRDEIVALRAAGVAVATATGLWLAEPHAAPVIGITGTKGKSTTATLIAHLLRASGASVELAGNVGRPVLDLLDAPAPEYYVVELSSYQIADLTRGPELALVTNLYAEHLDWHREEARYRADKLRLVDLPGVRDVVYNGLQPALAHLTGLAFGRPDGFHVAADGVRDRERLVVATADLPLRGAHNALNLAAALTALRALGVELDDVAGRLAGFRGLPHRLELVHAGDGVEWIDDSISTTPESALAAVAAFPDRPVVLIGGGFDRGQDYGGLGATLAARGAHVIGLPVTGERLVEAARRAGSPDDRLRVVADMEAAVAQARAVAAPGAAVLLSPAAPSFGAYADYTARGAHFRALVAGPR